MSEHNWSEYENDEEETVDDVISEIVEHEETQEQVADEMSEALFRMERANLYRSLLDHSFFGANSATHHIQAAVETEIREFVSERFKHLLGMSPQPAPKQESPFTEEEVEALKLLAGRITKKPEVVAPVQRVPQVNVAPPQHVQVRPKINPPVFTPTPTVKPAAQPVAPKQAPAKVTKPGRPKQQKPVEENSAGGKRYRPYKPKNNEHQLPVPSYNERLTTAAIQGARGGGNTSVQSVGAGGSAPMPAANLAGLVAQYATGSDIADQ